MLVKHTHLMTEEDGSFSNSEVLRNLLANIPSGDTGDSVAQLLAAAVAQFGSDAESSNIDHTHLSTAGNLSHDVQVLSEVSEAYDVVETDASTELPSTSKCKRMRIKIPVEIRKKIISMRKEGKMCVEISKELPVSVSGAQKVWERFLSTGTVHDRRPSTYAGRPRKYSYKVCNYSLRCHCCRQPNLTECPCNITLLQTFVVAEL